MNRLSLVPRASRTLKTHYKRTFLVITPQHV
jgi:hypothetical protein